MGAKKDSIEPFLGLLGVVEDILLFLLLDSGFSMVVVDVVVAARFFEAEFEDVDDAEALLEEVALLLLSVGDAAVAAVAKNDLTVLNFGSGLMESADRYFVVDISVVTACQSR